MCRKFSYCINFIVEQQCCGPMMVFWWHFLPNGQICTIYSWLAEGDNAKELNTKLQNSAFKPSLSIPRLIVCLSCLNSVLDHKTIYFLKGYDSSIALWVKPCWKVEIEELPKCFPQAPFLCGSIISDEIFGDCPLSSFTFDIYLVTSWTQSTAEGGFTIESVSIQAGCRKDVNEILRTSWM